MLSKNKNSFKKNLKEMPLDTTSRKRNGRKHDFYIPTQKLLPSSRIKGNPEELLIFFVESETPDESSLEGATKPNQRVFKTHKQN